MMTVHNRLDEDGKVLTPEEILYRVCILSYLLFLHTPCRLQAVG